MDDQGNQTSPKKQLADRLKSANNILVTVSRDPSVDQLAACIGLTLLLNKLNKHTVAVFSGEVPSTIEFLKPEETLQKNTDALRDFIIALDKDKADKLRYKVEDNVVRIFITPYKSSISQEDLEFSQGDFNVDVVVALGVKQQTDLDDSITAHGRILHDATVASINTEADGGLGTINWHDPQASSLSELVTDLGQMLGDKLLDNQVATALLTGIVAETKRFSNDKTSSQTMSASSALMAAGANQQLVATKLEEPAKQPQSDSDEGEGVDKAEKSDETDEKSPDGSLNISHDEPEKPAESVELPKPQPPEEPKLPEPPVAPAANTNLQPGAKLVTEPPTLGGALSANTKPEALDPTTDPMSAPDTDAPKLLNRSAPTPPPAGWTPPAPAPQTLTDLEQSVNSPHVDAQKLDSARDEVNEAFKGINAPAPTPTPIQALNAQPLGDKLHPSPVPTPMPSPLINPSPAPAPGITPNPMPTPTPGPAPVADSPLLPVSAPSPESSVTDPTPRPRPDSLSPTPGVADSTAPPPVPPPLPSQYLNPQNEPGHQKPPPL